jgi:hypothetical protein
LAQFHVPRCQTASGSSSPGRPCPAGLLVCSELDGANFGNAARFQRTVCGEFQLVSDKLAGPAECPLGYRLASWRQYMTYRHCCIACSAREHVRHRWCPNQCDMILSWSLQRSALQGTAARYKLVISASPAPPPNSTPWHAQHCMLLLCWPLHATTDHNKSQLPHVGVSHNKVVLDGKHKCSDYLCWRCHACARGVHA